MTERQQQFWLGLMVLTSIGMGAGLFLRASRIDQQWQPTYTVALHFDSGAGIFPSSPILLYGLGIGTVRSVSLDTERGGVVVEAVIREKHRLPADSTARISKSLLGETLIEVVPGRSAAALAAGARLRGQSAGDPMAIVARLEEKTVALMDSFDATSNEWRRLAVQVNGLMDSESGNLSAVVANAAQSLTEFSATMKSANQMVGEINSLVADPEVQAAIKSTVVNLPKIVNETRQTITVSRQAIENINRNMANLNELTTPLAERGQTIVASLDRGLANLDSLLAELTLFAKVVNTGDGTLQRLARDPGLYEHLDRSAISLAVLLKNLEPIVRDVREFSDKIARKPELLGVGGAISPSTGLRDSELLSPDKGGPGKSGVIPASGTRPGK